MQLTSAEPKHLSNTSLLRASGEKDNGSNFDPNAGHLSTDIRHCTDDRSGNRLNWQVTLALARCKIDSTGAKLLC